MRVPGIPFVQGRNAYTDRDGHKYGIAIHNTSNDASAEAEASYATRRTDGISSHFYADSDSVIQSLDTDDRAGHAGSYEGNEHAIAVEITGTNDKNRQWWLDNVAWDKLGAVLAALCKYYGIAVRRASVSEMQSNPKVKAFYSHDDMRRAWGGTTHTDPGPNFPWDRLFHAVDAALNLEEDMLTPAQDNALAETWALTKALRDGAAVPKAGNYAGGAAWAVEQIKAARTDAATAKAAAEKALAAAVELRDRPVPVVTHEQLVAALREVLRDGVITTQG